jgi:hypothetical protein
MKTVTEVENWTARLIYRKLVYLDSSGVLVNDLAKSIKNNGRVLVVNLVENQVDSTNKVIDSNTVKKTFDRLIHNSNSEYVKNIEKIFVIDKYSFKIVLKAENMNFLRLLSSHFFSIYNIDEGNPIESGLYKISKRKNSKLYFKRVTQDSDYPETLIMLKSKDKDFDRMSEYNFDTFLDYTTKYKSDEKLEYRIHENWGLLLNLKDRFHKLSSRKCLSQSIDRNTVINKVLTNHKLSYSLDNSFVESNKCQVHTHFNLLIPLEIKTLGEGLCEVFKKNMNVKCLYIKFTGILKRVKESKFDSALISVTTDSPFLESNIDLLKPRSNFSLVNKDVDVPLDLVTKTGKDFFREFERIIFENRYFISISAPTRTVYASDINKYKPSLVNPSNDSVENLKR